MLEGGQEAVRQCYALICRDPRHEQVTPLYHGPLAAPRFSQWSMRYVSSDGVADRAVSAFLDALQRQPTPETVNQAILLLYRLGTGSADWQAR